MQHAYRNLTSALRVIEGGDRVAPDGALAVYKESSEQTKARIREWITFRQTTVPALNKRLREANLAAIVIAGD